jgi:tRNA(fMet)-specific endonuclease VapC
MYLVDTNIISYWMRGERRLIEKIKTYAPSELGMSTITIAEIFYGIEKSPVKKKERQLKINQISSLLDIYSFDEIAAGKYAVIRVQLEKEGRVISERDTQIASIALANKLIVVTHNTKEFERVGTLKVEDWAITNKNI